jgi:hypothetical protein
VGIAREMPPAERAEWYRRLRGLRLTWFERMMARTAGIDIAGERVRFLRVLELAAGGSVPAPGVATAQEFAPRVAS